MSALLPEGIDHLADIPHTLFDAIQTGFVYLSFEELPKDEIPPRRIWDNQQKLKAHFEWVDRKRKAEMDPDGAIADQPIEDPVQNEAARDLING